MILKEKNGLSFFQFPNLAEFSDIQHGIFTRKGGYSRGPQSSLNVSFGIGDDEDAVNQNRLLISRCTGHKQLVFARQVHGTEIFQLRHADAEIEDRNPVPTADAMITDIPGKGLAIQTADCQAVLLYDPVRQVAGNVHSGWRGSIRNIAGLTVKAMQKDFACSPCDIIAGIGPSLGPCCAEFVNYQKEIPEPLWTYRDENNCFDFWKMTRDQLIRAGVSDENICSSGICTRCRTDLFFSYRGETATGRFASVIGLKSTSV
jgi:YfiH family protein